MCDEYFKAKDAGKTERERVEAALNALLEEHDDEKQTEMRTWNKRSK